jgi:hypothetical protein
MATQTVPPHFLPKYPLPGRDAIASAIETLLAVMDAIDGDPDVELNGDELDGTNAEDERPDDDKGLPRRPSDGGSLYGPGCVISDPDCAADDIPCDEPHQDQEEDYRAIPLYGIDQARGQTKEAEVVRAQCLAELGR